MYRCVQIGKEPPPEYEYGRLVKVLRDDGTVYYNHVRGSTYDRDTGQHMYALNESSVLYSEDQLKLVGHAEVDHIHNTGLLRRGLNGGWVHPLEQTEED